MWRKKAQKRAKEGKKKKGKSEKKEEKKKLTKEDKIFLVSLYPNGRSEEALIDQLKKQNPDVYEDVLKDRMRQWVIDMNKEGLVTTVRTEDVGTALGLTEKGVEYVRNKIQKFATKDISSFVQIINRLIEKRDKWSIEYYHAQAKSIISRNFDLFIIVFNPKSTDQVVKELKNPFEKDLKESDRYKKFQDAVSKMETLGLIEVARKNNLLYLSASKTAREIMPEILVENNLTRTSADDKKSKKKGKKISTSKSFLNLVRTTDVIVCVATFLAVLFAYAIIYTAFPIDSQTNMIDLDDHRGIAGLSWIPLFVALFYFILSRVYLYYFVKKK